MRRARAPRLTLAAAWVALAVTLAVCGLGLRLTQLQYRSVGGILLDIERRAAEGLRPALEARLTAEERRLLGLIPPGPGGLEALAELAAREPLAAHAFVFLEDGTLLCPLLGEGSRPPPGPLPDEDAPPDLEKALRLVWSQAPVQAAVEALDAVWARKDAAPLWRLRARALALGLLARSGAAPRAAEGYRAIFEDMREPILQGRGPTHLQLTAARIECLLAADLGAEARRAAEEALEVLRGLGAGPGARPRPGLAEAELFVQKARDAFGRTGGDPPAVLGEVEEAHAERRRSVATLEALRGWIFPPRPTEPAVEGGEPERLYEERPGPSGRRPALAVWTRHAPAPSGPGAAASGFLVDLHGLEEALARCLASVSPGTRLSAQALRRAEDDGFIDLAGLGGQRSFVRLGLEKRAWQERLGEARRPFKLAGGLIAVLMAVLVLGFVVLFRGVRAEMALSRLKTEFVANVSHELKTPLALIRLYGETLLLDRAPPGERRTYYQVITRESERLAHLIAKVLSFSSIEAGKKSYDLTATDVARVVRDTLETYRPHLEAQGFRHRLELPAERAVARADPDAVAQAVINLLENAVKYSRDEKEVTVAVREDGPWILVSVADRGIGVSPEDRDRVFEDYYRTKEARAIGTRGSGLGLSLVQHIMKAHGGRVDLQSEAGKGSVFTLRFPRLEDATRDSEVTR